MKRKFLTITAIIVLAFSIGQTTYAASVNTAPVAEVSTTLTDISKISKIEIHGNVELYVSAGANDKVKVYNKYYAESALVQSRNGVLRISSYTKDALVVWVTAADLRAITAYDNTQVKSFGNFSTIELEVNLYNTASAKLNLDAYNANINVNDHAKADITGNADVCNLNYSRSATVNASAFVAGNIIRTVSFDKADKPSAQDLVVL